MGWFQRAGVAIALTAVVMALGCARGTARAQVCDDGQKGGVGPITTAIRTDIIVPLGMQCHIGPQGSVEGDIQVEGLVNGNLKLQEGDVTVRGKLEGNIEASTDRTITIVGAVDGNIENKGKGNVIIESGGNVAGNIKLHGNGDVTLNANSWVDGNVEMEGSGKVTMVSGSTVGGNVRCGPGRGAIKGTVRGNVENC